MSEREEEGAKRDKAMGRVAEAPDNFYEDICDLLISYLVEEVRPGTTFIATDLFRAAMERDPAISPRERRVMGPVMRKLETVDLIAPTGEILGTVTRRSHLGVAREWVRTFTMKPFLEARA